MKETLPHIVTVLNTMVIHMEERRSRSGEPTTTLPLYKGIVPKEKFDEDLCRHSFQLWTNVLKKQVKATQDLPAERVAVVQKIVRMFISALHYFKQNQYFEESVEPQLDFLIRDINNRLVRSFNQ